MINKLFLQDLRCFHDQQWLSLAPLTFLVGENSTGKSTFLAAARIAWDLFNGRPDVDFNEDPFRLGAFEEIANYRGGRAGRASSFRVGMTARRPRHPRRQREVEALEVTGCFRSRGGQAELVSWVCASDRWTVAVEYRDDEARTGRVRVTGSDADFTFRSGLLRSGVLGLFSELEYLAHFTALQRDVGEAMELKGKFPEEQSLRDLERFAVSVQYGSMRPGDRTRPQAIAPIRTTPKRTYDPTKDEPTPEGGHVPMVLARLSAEEHGEWGGIKAALEAFGKASGLFNRISVQRLGGKQSAPFQVRVHIKGPEANLVDVGYGVSQVLPILVDCLRSSSGATMLLQQPEVHLHPRAQAELGSFFCHLAAGGRRQLLVETHSDYLLNRVRSLLKAGEVKDFGPEHVAVLFFERQGTTARIHELRLDEKGNLHGAPAGYRSFFLAEERRFWGE